LGYYFTALDGFRVGVAMGGTRIFELGAARVKAEDIEGAKENCCYRTFN